MKRGKGRPPKVKAYDANSIISKIKEEEQKFAAKCAENLKTLFDNIFTLAGDEDAPRKDMVAATKYCIEFAQKFEKDFAETESDEDKGSKTSEKSLEDKKTEVSDKISLVASKV